MKLPFGNFVQHETPDLESEFTCYYSKLEIDGESIVELDVLANIYKVGNVDILQAYRQNIGTL